MPKLSSKIAVKLSRSVLCHRPDPNTPIEETVRAMDDLVHEGLILYWGTSEWSAADIMRAHGIARELDMTPPTMEQPQYNMLHRERVEVEYLPLYRRSDLEQPSGVRLLWTAHWKIQERYPIRVTSYIGRVWLVA